MYRLVLAVTVLALSLFLGACTREGNGAGRRNPTAMVFTSAGVSLALGEGWERRDPDSMHSLYPPTLISPDGVVRIMLLPTDRCDPKTAAEGLRIAFDANPKAVRYSFRQENFTSASGLRGICVSFGEQARDQGRASETRSHHYLVRNRDGRCVAVNYLATLPQESEAVKQTIRSSLRLE